MNGRIWLGLFVLIVTPALTMGHAGGHGQGLLRTWTLKHDQMTIKASFHSVRADSVVLEDADHVLHVVAIGDLIPTDASTATERARRIQARIASTVSTTTTAPQRIDSSFALFKPRVSTRWDDRWFYVESDGMPVSMPAMVGITAWQQQVPIPQFYTGNNAWAIPLQPTPAATPISLDTSMHTGAVAIAVNGLPIFNPENNRGEFSQEIGELDAFGGHCGRADDYHYHIAPMHLQSIVGDATPIAWALDGYPLYGSREPDGSAMQTLDANLGHDWNGEYHYHGIDTRPFMIARMRGNVTIENDQIVPQARTRGVRPFLQPLRGASITGMYECDSSHYALRFTVDGMTRWVNYRWTPSGTYTYVFLDESGTRRTETYQRR